MRKANVPVGLKYTKQEPCGLLSQAQAQFCHLLPL